MDYVSPAIFDTDELAEGVYATGSGSGNGDCWTVDYTVTQFWNGQSKVIEVKASHSKEVAHQSNGTIITFMFDRPIVDAYAENNTDYQVEISGTVVKITRQLYANAFFSGDEVIFKLFINGKDQDDTMAANIIGKSISCIHN